MKKIDLGVCVEFTRKTGLGQLPYHKWFGDLFQCEGCEYQVIADYGRQAMQHHDHRYNNFDAHVKVPEL